MTTSSPASAGWRRTTWSRKLNAVREYGIKLPAANGKTATVGYCWGGSTSFMYATKQDGLNAAVVLLRQLTERR